MAIIAKIIPGQKTGYKLDNFYIGNAKKEACAKVSIAL